MSPSVLLRVASIVTLVFAAGHSRGGLVSWSPQGENEVLRAMRSYQFDAMGWSRTYWEFYMGFGWIISVFMLLQAVLLWQLAPIAKADPRGLRPLIATFALANAACGVLAWRFIFLMPAIFSAVIAVCLAAAFVAARDPGSQRP